MCEVTYIYKVVGYEVLTVVIMNNIVLRDMTACSNAEVNRREGKSTASFFTIEEKTSHATRKKARVTISEPSFLA
jgi:hypothetical protein